MFLQSRQKSLKKNTKLNEHQHTKKREIKNKSLEMSFVKDKRCLTLEIQRNIFFATVGKKNL